MTIRSPTQEQLILKHRSLFTNLDISFYSDQVSIEEGIGYLFDSHGWVLDKTFSISKEAKKISKPKLACSKIKKFNKP